VLGQVRLKGYVGGVVPVKGIGRLAVRPAEVVRRVVVDLWRGLIARRIGDSDWGCWWVVMGRGYTLLSAFPL